MLQSFCWHSLNINIYINFSHFATEDRTMPLILTGTELTRVKPFHRRRVTKAGLTDVHTRHVVCLSGCRVVHKSGDRNAHFIIAYNVYQIIILMWHHLVNQMLK